MKILLKIEELFLLAISVYVFSLLDYSWWWFIVLLLVPDVGMFGYIVNTKIGAWGYNAFHHRAVSIAVFFFGFWLDAPIVMLIGVIIFGHIAMDRLVGYGLKYEDNFKHTHLGWIK